MNKKTKPSLYSKKRRQNNDKEDSKSPPISLKINENQPWLYDDGSLIPDEKLKIVSRNWSPDIWEAYLTTLEAASNEDLLFDSQTSELVSEEGYTDSLFSTIKENPEENFQKLKTAVNRLMKSHLSKREFEIIELRYWDSLTIAEISKKLGIQRTSTQVYLGRAYEKISSQLFKESLKRYKYLKDLGKSAS